MTVEAEKEENKADEGMSEAEKEKMKKVKSDAKTILCKLLCRQWFLLILGFPFIFLATISDIFVPDYVGKIVNAYVEEDYEGEEGVYRRLREWMIILCIGVACTFCQHCIFGLTGERLGNDLRLDLFNAIIKKDISFFDSTRTGEMISRISSDTQIVQEGLTMAVA